MSHAPVGLVSCVRAAIPYLTGGQMIHPRRPVLRTRKKYPPPVVM